MISILVYLSVIFVALLLIRWKRPGKEISLPPGPRAFPLIGNVHQLLVRNHHKRLSSWATQFGKWYTLHLGTKKALVINDMKLVKEIFGNPASTGKFHIDVLKDILTEDGIVHQEGKQWAELRTSALKNLRDFGFGNISLEPLMQEEMLEMVERLKKESSKSGDGSISLEKMFQMAVGNALWTIVSGKRISLDEAELSPLLGALIPAFMTTFKKGLLFFPWLKHVAPEITGYNHMMHICHRIRDHIEKCVRTHEEFRSGDPKDLTDSYIQQVEVARDPDSVFYGAAGRRAAVASITEVFLGANEPLSVMQRYLIFYMARHPEVQDKVYQEIDKVIGSYREPSIRDRASMPYMEAVIYETLRYSTLIPFGIPHQLLEDIHCQGYTLPKGLILVANLYHIHHNKNVWGDPGNFRPDRFLEKRTCDLKDYVVSFQEGRRKCVGEAFTKEALFVFSTKLLQTFQVLPTPGVSPNQYMEPDSGGLVLIPKPLKIILKVRTTE